jgi:hypothetical protein
MALKKTTSAASPASPKSDGKEATAPAALPAAEMPKADRVSEAQKMSRFGLSTALTVVLIIAMMLAAFPTFVVFAIGMLPTFVGNITQLERNSYRYIALSALNFAGVMPYILDLWIEGDKLEIALRIVTDVYALFVMYGAAALAVAVFWAAPQIAASFLTVLATRRLNALRREQDAMIFEWGADVDSAAVPAAAASD